MAEVLQLSTAETLTQLGLNNYIQGFSLHGNGLSSDCECKISVFSKSGQDNKVESSGNKVEAQKEPNDVPQKAIRSAQYKV